MIPISHEDIQDRILDSKAKLCNLFINIEWFNLSKAFAKSVNITSVWTRISKLLNTCLQNNAKLMTVDFPGRNPCWLSERYLFIRGAIWFEMMDLNSFEIHGILDIGL